MIMLKIFQYTYQGEIDYGFGKDGEYYTRDSNWQTANDQLPDGYQPLESSVYDSKDDALLYLNRELLVFVVYKTEAHAIYIDNLREQIRYKDDDLWKEGVSLSDGEGTEHGRFASYAIALRAARDLKDGQTVWVRPTTQMPVLWIAVVQLFYVFVLFSPGVTFIGSMYAVVAQVAVIASAAMNHAPYIMTAARVSASVAVGNVLLAILVWQSAYSTTDQIAAAYRAAVVTVVGFAMVGTNQYLTNVADPASA